MIVTFRQRRWFIPLSDMILLSIGSVLCSLALHIAVWPMVDEISSIINITVNPWFPRGVDCALFLYFLVIRTKIFRDQNRSFREREESYRRTVD